MTSSTETSSWTITAPSRYVISRNIPSGVSLGRTSTRLGVEAGTIFATPAGPRRRQGDEMLSNAMVFSADSFGEGWNDASLDFRIH